MRFWIRCRAPGWSKRSEALTRREAWRLRRLTLEAMLRLCAARLLVRLVPLRLWRGRLGQLAPAATGTADPATLQPAASADVAQARRLALHVERAAARLPFQTKCLPRAIALTRMLQARRQPYALRIATLSAHERGGSNDLHAWVEVNGVKVIGDLPGNWIVIVNLIN